MRPKIRYNSDRYNLVWLYKEYLRFEKDISWLFSEVNEI